MDGSSAHEFHAGTGHRSHRLLGAHPGPDGTRFCVWAPNAQRVAVRGDWSGWSPEPLRRDGGLWSLTCAAAQPGDHYKFVVHGSDSHTTERADPYARWSEAPPKTASRIWKDDYLWRDSEWVRSRASRQAHSQAMSIYEVHLGSVARSARGDWLGYEALAEHLIAHCQRVGYSHVELLPITEHPFYGSWGYQTLGYFAPTARYGSPQQLMALIDTLHQAGIGVILDWVPSHFPMDGHGLYRFDGTHLFEHADPREGFHQDWQSAIFNYGRHEVRSFLLASALHWLETFHIDGLRVDAVASMLYRDYSRRPGEWVPNIHGGRENLEAIAFLKALNDVVHREAPGCITIAEESTAFPRVTHPDGLGFDYKWDMGWMHDTLRFFARDPIHRSHHTDDLSFRAVYADSERFVLALSHDEVVHGKGSLLGKMAGPNAFETHANLRALYAYQFIQPGQKLLFMGQDVAQAREWNHDASIDHNPAHGLSHLLADLNRLNHGWTNEPFRWVHCDDRDSVVLTALRGDRVVVLNCTPVTRGAHPVAFPSAGRFREVLNTDAVVYGGSGQGNLGGVSVTGGPLHGLGASQPIVAPGLSLLVFERESA